MRGLPRWSENSHGKSVSSPKTLPPADATQVPPRAFQGSERLRPLKRPRRPARAGKQNVLGDFRLLKKLGQGGMGGGV